jgi:uncharacterized membrane protein SirB2
MTEFFHILLRWIGALFAFCIIYCLLSFSAFFVEELTPINAQKFEYYLLGMFTLSLVERIGKDD